MRNKRRQLQFLTTKRDVCLKLSFEFVVKMKVYLTAKIHQKCIQVGVTRDNLTSNVINISK